MVPKEYPLIVLDIKSAMCMAKNGKDTKHTRHIARRMYFVRNGEKCKMHKIYWFEGGLQLAEIVTKNVSKPDLTPRIKYIMDRLENWRHNTCTIGVIEYRIVMSSKSSEWLDYIELVFDSISLKCLKNMKTVYQDENNVVLDENSVELKPCINR